jgi:hypothetical protein
VLPGATNTTLTLTNLQAADAGIYRMVVSNTCGRAFSQMAELTMKAPRICPVPNQFATVGKQLVISNCTEGMVPPVTFRLDPSAPAGAAISSNGVFTWTPACDQGGTTNPVMLWAVDSGSPASTNSTTFGMTVFECLEAGLGNTVLLAGQTSSVAVQLLSAIAMTNLEFTVLYRPERFTNFTFTVNVPLVITQWLSYPQPGRVQVGFAVPAESALLGPANVGQFRFTALSNQPSAFVPLAITNLTGLKQDGGAAANASGLPGRVVVIGPEPLLEGGWPGHGRFRLTLYGNPGHGHVLKWKDDLFGSSWLSNQTVLLSNLWQTFDFPANERSRFYRAYKE